VADKPNEQGVNEKKYFADQFEKTAYTLPYNFIIAVDLSMTAKRTGRK
jgi:hypothetical protein